MVLLKLNVCKKIRLLVEHLIYLLVHSFQMLLMQNMVQNLNKNL